MFCFIAAEPLKIYITTPRLQSSLLGLVSVKCHIYCEEYTYRNWLKEKRQIEISTYDMLNSNQVDNIIIL